MFKMDKKNHGRTWVGNMFQTFEAMCQEVDDFVTKDTVKYVENHVQTVGKSVKKFYSDVVQDILPPVAYTVKHREKSVPSKQLDFNGTHKSSVVDIKENMVDSDTNKSKEGSFSPLVPAEECHKPSTTALCDSEQISGSPVGEADADVDVLQEGDYPMYKTAIMVFQENSDTLSQENLAVSFLINEHSSQAFRYNGCIDESHDDDDPPAKIPHESSGNHLDNSCFEKKGILCDASSESDLSEYEDADCNPKLGIDIKIKRHSSPLSFEDANIENGSTETFIDGLGIDYFQEEKTFDNRSVDEFEHDSNTSSALQSSESESSVVSDVKIKRQSSPLSFEDANIENDSMETLIDDLGIDYFQEEKTLDNRSVEFECDANTSSVLRSSESESSIVSDEKKEEPALLYDSSSCEETDTIYCKPTESTDYFSVSSHGPASSESLPVLGFDNNNNNVNTTELAFSKDALYDVPAKTDEAVPATGLCRSVDGPCFQLALFETSASCARFGEGSSKIDIEDLKMDTIDLSDEKQLVESCVIVENEELYAFSRGSRRSKSYKKIIKDAFTSRKRIAKEYEQLVIWYGDINEEFIKPSEKIRPNINTRSESRVRDSHDSEWELV